MSESEERPGAEPTRAVTPGDPSAVGDGGAGLEGTGTVIDRYRLMEQIGSGGFGVVYRAEQHAPVRRDVALKVIRLGMDTEQVIARFEAERQALALMEHPGIAKVLDAGTTRTGRPYFVMELVHGAPITRFCDRQRLTMRARVELLIDVCDAVQHAHHKGIIHRDLKPSNVLVSDPEGTGRPVGKVIDFGIAKATEVKLTDQTVATMQGQFIGTPEYMSPEQASAGAVDIDTRSDLYSLGVLLYEMLTGTTPFDADELARGGLVELQRIIREQDPPKPSSRLSELATPTDDSLLAAVAERRATDPPSLTRALRGDLDWIVMKALEKDRSRRYASAFALAADLRRYLDDQPVDARPPSTWYRFTKFSRRHRTAVVAATTVVLALIAGLIGTTWQMSRARAAERAATSAQVRESERADEAEAVAAFLGRMLEQADPWKSGGDVSVATALASATDLIDEMLGSQPAVEAAVLRTIGGAYRGIGAFDEAERHLDRSVQLHESRWGNRHERTLAARAELGALLIDTDRLDAATALYQELVPTAEQELGLEHDTTQRIQLFLAALYHNQGRFEEAELLKRQVYECRRRQLGDDDERTNSALSSLGETLTRLGRLEEAVTCLKSAAEIHARVRGATSGPAIAAHNLLANAYIDQGLFDEAESIFRETLAASRELFGTDHPASVIPLNGLSRALQRVGRRADAEPYAREAMEIYERRLGPEHQFTLVATAEYAGLLLRTNRTDEAEPLIRRTLEIRKRVLGEKHPDVGQSLAALGTLHWRTDRSAEAEPLFRASTEVYRAAYGGDTGDVIDNLVNLTLCLLAQEKYEEAVVEMEQVVAFDRAELQPKHTFLANDYGSLGKALIGAGRAPDAIPMLREALEIRLHNRGETHRSTARTRSILAAALMETGAYEEAELQLVAALDVYRSKTDREEMNDDARKTVERLVELYEKWGRPDEADVWRQKLAGVRAP